MPPTQASASERTTRSNSPGQVVLAPNSADRVGRRETAPTRAPVAMRWGAVIRAHRRSHAGASPATRQSTSAGACASANETPSR